MFADIWYTARDTFDPDFVGWKGYTTPSIVSHLTEVVTLDYALCELVFEFELKDEHDWVHPTFSIHEESGIGYFLECFNSFGYVMERVQGMKHFNLLAVIREPISEKRQVLDKAYEFVGYDLIEKDGGISALTNCGDMWEDSCSVNDINQYGLISDYKLAREVQRRLPLDNPLEVHHADCYLYEIWRHKTIGRKHPV